jgi:hypothetical protein
MPVRLLPQRKDFAMSKIRDALMALGTRLWAWLDRLDWTQIPTLHFWLTGSAVYTMGSFVLFAGLGFAGVTSVTARYRKIMVCAYVAAFVLFILGCWQTAQQEQASAELQSKLDRIVQVPAVPDITLRLVDPKAPDIQVVNTSDAIAHTVRCGFALFDLDSDHENSLLSIPGNGPDFVRPHSVSGPTIIFPPSMQSRFKSGEKLFGTIGLICPECERGRTFWVYITWGEGGWFSEIPNEEGGNLMVPKGQNYWDADNVNTIINSIPVSARIEIKDRNQIDVSIP